MKKSSPMLDAPRFSPKEEHRSRSADPHHTYCKMQPLFYYSFTHQQEQPAPPSSAVIGRSTFAPAGEAARDCVSTSYRRCCYPRRCTWARGTRGRRLGRRGGKGPTWRPRSPCRWRRTGPPRRCNGRTAG